MYRNMKKGQVFCRPQWLLNYNETIPDQIWYLLVSRFYTAMLLCAFFDLILLLFSCYLSYLLGVPVGKFVSTSLLIMVQPGVAVYGLLLCDIHNKQPISYQTRLHRLGQEMPQRLRLLVTVLYVGILTSWMYACFVDMFNDDWPPYYLPIHGFCCGICYYLAEYGRCLRRFSLPGLDVGQYIWRSIVESMFQSHKVGLAVGTTLASGLIQSYYWVIMLDGDLGQGWSAGKMFRAWILATLVLAKLHLTKHIYEVVMQQELPLVLNPRQMYGRYNRRFWEPVILWICRQQVCPVPEDMNELELSFSMALDTECLHGFRLLAASDFNEAASSQRDRLCSTIFSRTQQRTSWLYLRELLMKMVDEFVANMKKAMEATTFPCQIIQKPQMNRPRNAGYPSTTTTQRLSYRDQHIERGLNVQSTCQPIQWCPICNRPLAPITGIDLQLNEICQCKIPLQSRGIWNCVPILPALVHYFCDKKPMELSIWSRSIWNCVPILPALVQYFCNTKPMELSIRFRGIWNCVTILPALVHYFCDTNPMEKINHALRRAEHLDDVLQGLVRICIRSLKEDENGLMESDLVRFMEALVQVENQLHAALNLKKDRNVRLCGTHQKLLVSIQRCMMCMLQNFSPHLDSMVQDKEFLNMLKCRMKSLDIPHR